MAQIVNKMRTGMKVLQFDFDPDGVNPVDVSWQDASLFACFLFGFFRTVGTGAVDTMRVIGNSKADGSGTDVVIVTKDLAGVQPDALGDTTWLECTAEQISHAGAAAGQELRYISLQLEFATATDEGVATYIFGEPRFAHDQLTADVIA